MTKPLNFVMISPHFPYNFEPFAHRLHEAGVNTLGIADTPYEMLPQSLRDNLTEYYRVDNMEDYDQVYRAVAYFAHKYGRIDRIESHNEYWLELDAQLRTDFNVFGYKTEDMLAIKTKAQMKEVFRKEGLKVANGRVFTDDADARKLAKELKFPVIIKPNSGVGASDTYKIKSDQELEDFFGYKTAGVEYIMEEFIDGDIVTFDGLCDHEGNIVFHAGLEYSDVVLETVSGDKDMFFYVNRELSKDLIAMGERCVKAFNIHERFFHFEFFRIRETGEIIPLEINCRPPGGATIDMWNYANDFDVFKEYTNIVLGRPFEANITRPYYCFYMSRKEKNNYKHNLDEIWVKYPGKIISIEEVAPVFQQIMGKYGVLARAESREGMEDIVKFVQETV